MPLLKKLNSRSGRQEILCLLWNPNVLYRTDNSPLLDHTIVNSVHPNTVFGKDPT
jgi:hypothetical protein